MLDATILDGIAGERKTTKGEKKHYIPFNLPQWEVLEAAFGRKLKPNDLKLLIMAMAAGKVGLTKVKL